MSNANYMEDGVQAAIFPGQLFDGGLLVATPGAMDCLCEHEIDAKTLLQRHFSADWGVLGQEDAQANDLALKSGWRLLSSYPIGPACKVWIITEADRSATTILLPEEY